MKPSRIAIPRGFTLIEVLVAVLIIAVGLLGLAKIQALAYASTGEASQESLAALQAAGLASAMRANRGYWSAVTTPYTYNSANSGADTDSAMTAAYACALPAGTAFTVSLCTPQQLAAYDLQNWVASLATTLPNPTTIVTCSAASGTLPLGCWITVNWIEETVAINSQSAGGTLTAPSYTLYVVP